MVWDKNCTEAMFTHSLTAADGVEEGLVVSVADLGEHVGQLATVPQQLGIHEALKVKQVGNDVDRCQ